MSIKILSADEIKQKRNSYDIPPVLFANPKNLYQRRAKRFKRISEKIIHWLIIYSLLQMLWKAN